MNGEIRVGDDPADFRQVSAKPIVQVGNLNLSTSNRAGSVMAKTKTKTEKMQESLRLAKTITANRNWRRRGLKLGHDPARHRL